MAHGISVILEILNLSLAYMPGFNTKISPLCIQESEFVGLFIHESDRRTEFTTS